MKKTSLKPGYEFIFTLSLLAILGLPPLVFAQGTKDVQISIANGDTTINGKNIKDLSPKERKEAMRDIVTINSSLKGNADAKGPQDMRRDRRMAGGDMKHDSLTVQDWSPDKRPLTADNDMGPLGKTHNMRLQFMDKNHKDSTFAFDLNLARHPKDRPVLARAFRSDDFEVRRDDREFNRKNTQTFSYSNTDSQGISTRVSFRVTEPSGAIHHESNAGETPQFEVLELKDLTIVPEFEAGKTILSFSLPTKAAGEVQFKDSQGAVLWSEKIVNGEFSKSFSLGLNGEYYLHVKQGGKMAVKKIFKE